MLDSSNEDMQNFQLGPAGVCLTIIIITDTACWLSIYLYLEAFSNLVLSPKPREFHHNIAVPTVLTASAGHLCSAETAEEQYTDG